MLRLVFEFVIFGGESSPRRGASCTEEVDMGPGTFMVAGALMSSGEPMPEMALVITTIYLIAAFFSTAVVCRRRSDQR